MEHVQRIMQAEQEAETEVAKVGGTLEQVAKGAIEQQVRSSSGSSS